MDAIWILDNTGTRPNQQKNGVGAPLIQVVIFPVQSASLNYTTFQIHSNFYKQNRGKSALYGLSVVIYVAEGNVHSCMRHTSRLLNNLKGDIFFNAISNSQTLFYCACIAWAEELGWVKDFLLLTTPKNIISTVRLIVSIFLMKHTGKRKVFVNMGGYSFVLISMFIYLHKWPNNVCSLSHYSHIMYVVIYIYIYIYIYNKMPYRRGTFNLIRSTRIIKS